MIKILLLIVLFLEAILGYSIGIMANKKTTKKQKLLLLTVGYNLRILMLVLIVRGLI